MSLSSIALCLICYMYNTVDNCICDIRLKQYYKEELAPAELCMQVPIQFILGTLPIIYTDMEGNLSTIQHQENVLNKFIRHENLLTRRVEFLKYLTELIDKKITLIKNKQPCYEVDLIIEKLMKKIEILSQNFI